MIEIVAWITLYFGVVTLLMVMAHQHEVREHLARDRQPDEAGCEVESVPIHADGMTQNGVRNHVG